MSPADAQNTDTRESRISWRFLRYLAAGGFAAALNFSSRIVLSKWMEFAPAVVLAYLIGLMTAFVLFRQFVFTQSDKPVPHQIFWFVAVNLAAMLQTLLVSLLLAEVVLPRIAGLQHTHEIAHAIGVATPVFTSYLGHKWLSFSHK